MDSELQADLDRWDDPLNPRTKAQTARIVEAARKVANPDYEAALKECAAWFDEYRKSSEITAATYNIVDVALGIGEAPDGQ